MKVFRLYVRLGNKWEMVCSVIAEDQDKALKEALALLQPEHRNKPYEIRPENAGPPTVAK